jgi:hypothetical protein
MGLLSNSFDASMVSGAGTDMLEALPDTGTVYRPVKTQGAIGGTSYNVGTGSTGATVVASNIAVNIQNIKPTEIQTFARRGIKVSNRLFFNQDIGAKVGDFMPNPNNAAQTFVFTFLSDMGGEHSAFQAYANLIQ